MVGPAEREVLTWDMFGAASRGLAQQVADSDYRPDIILGIARGGLLPAATIAYALDVKNVFMISVEFYTGVDERLDFPVMLPPLLNAVEIVGARLLITDDVADTGGTLKMVKDFCSAHVADVRCAVIYEKPPSVVKCEYVWRRTARWVNFPWSSAPPVIARAEVATRGEVAPLRNPG
jgi:hypoxanthine phosphoribosyltransferase